MEINPKKATICITDLDNPSTCPPVIHQDYLIDNTSPILIYQSAQGLLYIANKTAQETVINWSDPKTHSGNKNLALLSTTAINYSFSAELFLKGILLMENGNYKRGHNLKELFLDLKKETQSELEAMVDKLKLNNPDNVRLRCLVIVKSKPNEKFETKIEYPKIPSISEFLVEHKSPFVNWRYYFEFNVGLQHMFFDLRFMDCFTKALFEKLGNIRHGDNDLPIGQKSDFQ